MGILQARNTGVGGYALLQGIFPIQGSNPGLPQCRQILYQLRHQGNPREDSREIVRLLLGFGFHSENEDPIKSLG